DPLPVLPLTLGGDWVEVKRCDNECCEDPDYPYTWEYSVSYVRFENPNADHNGPAPYSVTYLIAVANDIQGAKNQMDVWRADLTSPYVTNCGRELTGLPAFGMDSHGYVQRYFHPVTLECWPADKYPVPYYLRFRIANVLVLVVTLSNNDDEAPRAADLIRRGQVIEQRVRDQLVYN
ncbi:MAG TPA: hypothetical protein VM223_26010, partial [Planctomycetota bacterium]|nr:hypothetical protein [Planctomycetota bacterium]